jgi:hypothetical protein
VRYLAVTEFHGPAADGSRESYWVLSPVEHEFFAKNVDQAAITKWGVRMIYRMLEDRRKKVE